MPANETALFVSKIDTGVQIAAPIDSDIPLLLLVSVCVVFVFSSHFLLIRTWATGYKQRYCYTWLCPAVETTLKTVSLE